MADADHLNIPIALEENGSVKKCQRLLNGQNLTLPHSTIRVIYQGSKFAVWWPSNQKPRVSECDDFGRETITHSNNVICSDSLDFVNFERVFHLLRQVPKTFVTAYCTVVANDIYNTATSTVTNDSDFTVRFTRHLPALRLTVSNTCNSVTKTVNISLRSDGFLLPPQIPIRNASLYCRSTGKPREDHDCWLEFLDTHRPL